MWPQYVLDAQAAGITLSFLGVALIWERPTGTAGLERKVNVDPG
jgi:hypothetical protein